MQSAILFYKLPLSVCLSVYSGMDIILVFFVAPRHYKIPRGTPKHKGVGIFFLQISPFISKMVRDRAIVTTEH